MTDGLESWLYPSTWLGLMGAVIGGAAAIVAALMEALNARKRDAERSLTLALIDSWAAADHLWASAQKLGWFRAQLKHEIEATGGPPESDTDERRNPLVLDLEASQAACRRARVRLRILGADVETVKAFDELVASSEHFDPDDATKINQSRASALAEFEEHTNP